MVTSFQITEQCRRVSFSSACYFPLNSDALVMTARLPRNVPTTSLTHKERTLVLPINKALSLHPGRRINGKIHPHKLDRFQSSQRLKILVAGEEVGGKNFSAKANAASTFHQSRDRRMERRLTERGRRRTSWSVSCQLQLPANNDDGPVIKNTNTLPIMIKASSDRCDCETPLYDRHSAKIIATLLCSICSVREVLRPSWFHNVGIAPSLDHVNFPVFGVGAPPRSASITRYVHLCVMHAFLISDSFQDKGLQHWCDVEICRLVPRNCTRPAKAVQKRNRRAVGPVSKRLTLTHTTGVVAFSAQRLIYFCISYNFTFNHFPYLFCRPTHGPYSTVVNVTPWTISWTAPRRSSFSRFFGCLA
ncbi:hypothetical protein J6590_007366 [Homalodisca vitripennis]|nr:hypothetical protein J6590_007366 [Homalodisca vitripennis]